MSGKEVNSTQFTWFLWRANERLYLTFVNKCGIDEYRLALNHISEAFSFIFLIISYFPHQGAFLDFFFLIIASSHHEILIP